LEHRSRIQRKTLGIVGIIARRSPIQRFAVEKRRVFDEVKMDSGMASAAHDRAKTVLIVKWDRDAAQRGFGVGQLGLPIFGKVNRHLMTEAGEGARQSAHNIGQRSEE